MVTGKELEESLQELYKKYIQTLTTSEDPNISATAMLAVCVDEGSMLRGNPKVKEKVESLLHGSNGNSAKMTQSSHRKGSIESNLRRVTSFKTSISLYMMCTPPS